MARYGDKGGDIAASLAAMKEAQAQQGEMDAKEKRYQESQERSGELARKNAAARREVSQATRDLGSSLGSGQDLISADTEAWRANTVVLRENLSLRQQIRQVGGVAAPLPAGAPVAAPAPVAATRPARMPAAPAIVGTGDLQSAREAERAAIARAEQARVDVAEARRTKAPPESIATLTQARGEATAAAQAARRNITALEREAAASEAAAVAAREKAAADERAAVAARVKAEADYRAAQAAKPYAPAGTGGAAPGGYGLAAVAETEQQRVAAEVRARVEAAQARAQAQAAQPYAAAGTGGRPPGGGFMPPAPPGAGGLGGGGGEDDYNRKLKQTAASAETASVSERSLQHDIQASGAAYAASSNALSRHGALTTEFIQALARGDVTLREFGSQMVSTIGKFGGWLVAGAAIFGVIKLFDDLKAGALDTQEAIVNLGRFIPGLGGPAGGGGGQIGQAQELLRNISTQFNVPISEVSDSMQVVARVFHNLGDAGDATRAVLAASRLDQIPAAQSTQYLLGISQSLGFAGQRGGGAQLMGIVQSLNELQSHGGARVAQTLPAYARAAPSALAGGVSQNTLETLVAMGVTAGIQPGTVGTALARTLGGTIFQPKAQALLTSYGIQPSGTSAEGAIRGLFDLMTRRREEGRPLGQRELREIATTISTPNQATRVILPLLEQQNARPRRFEEFSQQLRDPRSLQADLDANLSSITERFKGVGNALQNFGSQLATIGALGPINAFFDTLQFLAQAFQTMATPVEEVAKAFDKLSGPMEEVLLTVGAAVAAQRLYKRTFVGSTAEDFAGRLAGRDEFERTPRQVVRQRLAESRNILLPEEQAQLQQASRKAFLAQERLAGAERDLSRYEAGARASGLGREGVAAAPGTAGEMYEEVYARKLEDRNAAGEKVATADREAATAAEQVARRMADISLMKDKSLEWNEKILVMEERGYVAAARTVGFQEEQNAVLASQIARVRGGGTAGAAAREAVRPGETLAGATAGGAAAGVTAAAMVEEVTKPVNVAKVADAINNMPSGAMHGPEIAPLEQYPVMSPLARRIRQATGEVVPPESPSLAARRMQEYAGGPPIGPEEASGLMATQALRESQQRMLRPSALGADALSGAGGLLSTLRETRAAQAVQRLGSFAANNAAAIPFAGIVGTQLLANTIGGGLGGAISKIGEPASGGAMISQMLGRGIGPGLGAGLVLGGIQQGGTAGAAAGGIGGALLGRGVASAIAALSPADTLAPEFAIPIQGALALGGAAVSLFKGGSKSPQDDVNDAAKRANAAVTSTQGIGASVERFSSEFGASVQDSISGTGQAASRGSAYVQKAVEGITAQMQLFGATSEEGKKAQAQLSQVVSIATAQIGTDPGAAQNILQGVQAAGQQVVTRTTLALKYANPRDALKIAEGGISQLDTGGTVRADEIEQRGILARTRARLAAARASGSRTVTTPPAIPQYAGTGLPGGSPTTTTGAQNIQRLQEAVDAAKQKLDATSAELRQIDLMRKEMTDQIAVLGFQASRRGEVTQLARAQARTGDPLQQAILGARAAEQGVREARTNPLLRGQARQEAIQQAETLRQQAEQGQAQALVGGIQAAGAVTQAAIPSTNPVGRASAALKTAADSYNAMRQYMQRHAAANNPQLLNQALAGMLSAQQAVADAAYQQQQELAGSVEQLAVARAHGDPALVARASLVKGRTDLAQARTQAQKNAAIAEIIAAEDAGVDATRQWADAQAQLAEARTHGDAGLNAAIELRAGQRDLDLAKNREERAAALTRIANAQTAGREAARAASDARTQIATAGDFGDSVAQANDAIAGANNQLRLAQTGSERLSAQAGLLNAVNQRQQAIADRFTEFAALAASETIDPVEAARRIAEGAQRALGATRGVDNIAKAAANRNQTLQAYRSAKIDTQESDITFEFQMSEITTGSAVARLQGLLKLQGLTKAKRQQILEEIRRYQTGQEQPIGAQGFDLAPGNIRLPTFYDVANAVSRGQARSSAINHNDSRRYNNTVTVYVNRAEDAGAVSDAIDRSLGSNVRQRIKMAGVR